MQLRVTYLAPYCSMYDTKPERIWRKSYLESGQRTGRSSARLPNSGCCAFPRIARDHIGSRARPTRSRRWSRCGARRISRNAHHSKPAHAPFMRQLLDAIARSFEFRRRTWAQRAPTPELLYSSEMFQCPILDSSRQGHRSRRQQGAVRQMPALARTSAVRNKRPTSRR